MRLQPEDRGPQWGCRCALWEPLRRQKGTSAEGDLWLPTGSKPTCRGAAGGSRPVDGSASTWAGDRGRAAETQTPVSRRIRRGTDPRDLKHLPMAAVFLTLKQLTG